MREPAPVVVIATGSSLPLPDPDEAALLSALRGRGAEVSVIPWDASETEHAAPRVAHADVVVIRSTWNYVKRRDLFVSWARAVEAAQVCLLNPAEVIAWNTDKHYLRELAEESVPVVPTRFIERGASRDEVSGTLAECGWSDVVIKPTVSAGSFATERFQGDSLKEAVSFASAQLDERAMMVQPYQPSVEAWGERSLVFIEGELTHATRKSPRFAEGPLVVSGAVDVPEDEQALARAVFAVVGARFALPLLYARVDLVRDERGAPRLMELEATEPYLMLDRSERALARLADGIVERARRARASRPVTPPETPPA